MFYLDLNKCGVFHPFQAFIKKSSTITIALFADFYSSILDNRGGNVGELITWHAGPRWRPIASLILLRA